MSCPSPGESVRSLSRPRAQAKNESSWTISIGPWVATGATRPAIASTLSMRALISMLRAMPGLLARVGDEAQVLELLLGVRLVHQLRHDPPHQDAHLDLQPDEAFLERLEGERQLLLRLGGGGHLVIAGIAVDEVEAVRLGGADLLPVQVDVGLHGRPGRAGPIEVDPALAGRERRDGRHDLRVLGPRRAARQEQTDGHGEEPEPDGHGSLLRMASRVTA